jgi:hypothetical protein
MLNINSNETKKLKFGIAVAGVQTRDIQGALRLTVEGIEYGFPVSIREGNIEVEIPPLKRLVNEIDCSKKYDAKLELIAGDTYIMPWVDKVEFKAPVSVKVSEKIVEETEPKKKIKVTKFRQIFD